jgi:hypothetical protein
MAGKLSYPLNLGLGDAPDPALDSAVWHELNKLSLAAKFIASSLGLTLNSGEGSGAVIEAIPEIAGVTIQDYARLRKVTNEFLPAGSVVQLGDTTPGSTAVHKTSGTYPYPVAFCENQVDAGGVAELTLLGMVVYAPANLSLGAKYYIDTANPGMITAGSDNRGRYVGMAFAPNVLWFDPVRV